MSRAESAAPIRIDRCVCKERPFRELLVLAEELGGDIDLVALATGASIDCATCRPWLERALASGRSCFELDAERLAPEEAQRLAAHFGTGHCGG